MRLKTQGITRSTKKKEKKNLNLMTRSIIDVFDTEGNKIY